MRPSTSKADGFVFIIFGSGMVQMAGGDYSMDYTREDAYFRAHCLSQDVVDIFNMMSDCALEPRSVVTANAGQAKNKETHNFEGLLSVGESFDDQVFETAFGQEGLGMPLRGLHHNIGNLNAYTLQKFQVENIRPDRIIVLGAGVHNHNEFVELVQDKFGGIPAVDGKVTERAPAKYAGGEVRSLLESSRVHVGLAFPSVSWSDNSVPAFQVLATLLHNPYTSHYQTLGLLQKNSTLFFFLWDDLFSQSWTKRLTWTGCGPSISTSPMPASLGSRPPARPPTGNKSSATWSPSSRNSPKPSQPK